MNTNNRLTKYTLDELQFYVTQASASNITTHPLLSEELDLRLLQLEYKGKISLTPLTILNIYNNKINKVVI